ncbi:MAG: sulfatase, partial [Phycisphaerales bacterium]|nr:sulfatase [Phycisphaerales bacterium]
AFVPFVIAPFLLHLLVDQTKFVQHRLVRIANTLLTIGLVWLILMVFGASWGGFSAAGSFLDRDAIRFWAPQPLQVFHYVNPLVLYGIPTVILIVAAGIAIILLRWLRNIRAASQYRFIRLFIYFIVAMPLLIFFGRPSQLRVRVLINDPFVGVPYTTGEWYSRSLYASTGAFIHGFLDIRKSLFPDEQIPVASEKIGVSYPPIISMEQYLASADQAKIRRMNVVVVMCESLRADVLRTYGASREIMPNMERMADESQVFTDAYTTASHTNYAEMTPFSSQYPLRSHETYLYPTHIPFPHVMIYDILKSLNYRTGIFASANLQWGRMINYLDTGNIDHLMNAANWGGPTYVNPTDTGFSAWVAKSKNAGSIDDQYTVDEAIKWVGQGPKAPFFIYFNLQSTHFPYRIPAEAKRKFSDGKIDFMMTFGHFPPEKLREIRDLYDDSAYYIDQQLGRFIDYLKQQGVWDNTIIILSGDHGEAFLEHHFATHAGPLYNEVMKVPLVMRIPGMASRRWDRLADHIDVAPTLLHALGLPPHPAFQGINLLGPPPTAPRTVYMVAQSPLAHQYALVRGRYRLLYDRTFHKRILYDLQNDPGEKRDIAEEHPEIVRELSERLDTWRAVQVGYYSNALQQKMSYAPIVSDQ